jgi:hypothetical protein
MNRPQHVRTASAAMMVIATQAPCIAVFVQRRTEMQNTTFKLFQTSLFGECD